MSVNVPNYNPRVVNHGVKTRNKMAQLQTSQTAISKSQTFEYQSNQLKLKAQESAVGLMSQQRSAKASYQGQQSNEVPQNSNSQQLSSLQELIKIKNQMESGTLSSQKSVKVISGSSSKAGLNCQKSMSKKNGSSIKSMHSFTSKSTSQKFDQESRFSIVLPPREEESCIIEESGVWNTQRFIGRSMQKSLSPNNRSSKSPPATQRVMKKLEKNHYQSLQMLDIQSDKDSWAAKKVVSKKADRNNSTAQLELKMKKTTAVSSIKTLNINLPKTIGNTSTIRPGKYSHQKRLNRLESNSENSPKRRQVSDDSRKTGTTYEDTTKKGNSLAFSKSQPGSNYPGMRFSLTKSHKQLENRTGAQARAESITFSATFSESKNEGSQTGAQTTQKKSRRRYNPYRDPNFDPNSAEYINYERRNSMFSKSEIQNLNKILIPVSSGIPLDIHQDSPIGENSSAMSSKVASSLKSSQVDQQDTIVIQQCKMKRQRFTKEQVSQSQIGGGKNFRQSQVTDIKQQAKMKSFASRIKANSLSDIESINSDEENDESSLLPQPKNNESKIDIVLDLDQIVIQENKGKWQQELVPQLVVIEEIQRQPPLQTDLKIQQLKKTMQFKEIIEESSSEADSSMQPKSALELDVDTSIIQPERKTPTPKPIAVCNIQTIKTLFQQCFTQNNKEQ